VETRYPIRAVAQITGLSLDTLRAWERRYKAVVPKRSGRSRQYDAADIERLLLLGRLVEKGHSIGGIAPLTDQELLNLLSQHKGPDRPEPVSEPAEEILTAVLDAIGRLDSEALNDHLSRIAALLSPRDVVYRLTIPLMQEVGDRWYEGKFTVAQEHLVSGMMRSLLGSLMRLCRPPRPAARMVLSTPVGEQHEFGILCAAMLLAMGGIEPVYLGPNLPANQILQAAEWVSAAAIILGVTMISDVTVREVRAIVASMPRPGELWLGGLASAKLGITNQPGTALLLNDLPALERECLRWRN
jgi:DNA-binding transcriptional MerR regulator